MKAKKSHKFLVNNQSPQIKPSLIEELQRDTDWRYLNSRACRRIGSNLLIQKNLPFLRSYSDLFGKATSSGSTGGGGAGDILFRKSLRDYSRSLDIIKELRLKEKKVSKSVKQKSHFTDHHCHKLDPAKTASPENFKNNNEVVTELFVNKLEAVKLDEEEESLAELTVQPTRESHNILKMAEDLTNDDFDENLQMTEDDNELEEVEKMIRETLDQLRQMAEEKAEILADLKEDEEEPKPDVPTVPVVPASAIDSPVVKELEEAEQQAKITAEVIANLKMRVAELLQKEKMTPDDAKELEEKNKSLKNQMLLFEEKTKKIQDLLIQKGFIDKRSGIRSLAAGKHTEDMLPKMLFCCVEENTMPKIVVCDQAKPPRGTSTSKLTPRGLPTGIPAKCQPVPRQDNRYNLLTDQNVESLKNKLLGLQSKMPMVRKEKKMITCANPSCPTTSRPPSPTVVPCQDPCAAEFENRLNEYSNTTDQLEKQLTGVETEVKNIHKELLAVQKEREHLEHHRKMLAIKPTVLPQPCHPAPPCQLAPTSCNHPYCPAKILPCISGDSAETVGEDQQYKELKEKYSRLQEDLKAKLTEVAGLRADNEKLKELAETAEANRAKLELKVKEMEKKFKELRGETDKGIGSKEQLIDVIQQLKVHKELYRQAQDELDELRALVEDLQGQLYDYRNKYIESIQTIEEQRRQIELMRMENSRISEQVSMDILRVKNQFQEKLQELAPLPEILKATQTKLHEAQQMHLLAERNNEVLANELKLYKTKVDELSDELALFTGSKTTGEHEQNAIMMKLKSLEEELEKYREENDELRIDNGRLQEKSDENERLANERQHEIVQLETQMEGVREDAARQVARIKDRCEIVRRSMQNQIGDLERQLAQTKAMAKSAEKERDGIRQKMQTQIRNLNENFEDAQMRIRNLQGHVNFLKDTPSPQEVKLTNDPCDCGPTEYCTN